MDNNYENINVQLSSDDDTCEVKTAFLRNGIIRVCAIVGSLVLVISAGMTVGVSAIMIPQLQQLNSKIPINEEQASWIASSMMLIAPLSALTITHLMKQYGRILSHYLMCIPWIAGYSVIIFACSIHMLYLGRILTGVSFGVATPVAGVYLAEISIPRYRGLILSGISFSLAFGIAVCHLLGTFYSYKVVSMIIILITVIGGLMLLIAPESPNWLLSKGHHEKAKKSFFLLRNVTDESRDEYRKLKQSYKNSSESPNNPSIFSRKFLKPFLLIIFFFITHQFCALNFITFYTVYFCEKSSIPLDPHTSMIILDFYRLLMTCIGCVLLKIYSRKSMLLFSAAGTVPTLFLLALYFGGVLPTSLILQMFILLLYISFCNFGIAPLPWMMVNEVFPISLREKGSSIANAMAFIIIFIAVKTSLGLVSLLGMSGTFYFFAISTTIGSVVIYFNLPETNNLTLKQVEDVYINEEKDVCPSSPLTRKMP